MTTIDKQRKATGSKKGGKLLSCATLLLFALGSQSGYAAEVGTAGTCTGVNDANVTEVTKPSSDSDTTGVMDLYQGMENVQSSQSEVIDSTNEQLGDVLKPENNESPVNVKAQLGVGREQGEVVSYNRFSLSTTMNDLFNTYIYTFADVNVGSEANISGKVTTSTPIINKGNVGVSLDTDLSFTGSGKNVLRGGIGGKFKLGEIVTSGKMFLYNSDGTPLTIKVSASGNIGKKFNLSCLGSFTTPDWGYYGEIEGNYSFGKDKSGGISMFGRLILKGKVNGRFGSEDRQNFVLGFTIPLPSK